MIDEIQVSQQGLIAARERLRFDATHDALTGAWNRFAALELLDREIARGEREKEIPLPS
jgi:GGDEF domain-containing protein